MTSSLLKTKLRIPPGRSTRVSRPRLNQKLDQALTHPLTLISAPPGFGKTTLVTAWLERKPTPAAWLSLDESDNDLGRFLAYLVAALETVQADVGRQSLNRLHSRRTPSTASVMTLLSNDLAAIPHDFILVLDDYHLIELQAIHEAMAFLLDHLPQPMHLVIATRADPPLPLARLRARDQLIELRAPDLRFSPEEAAAFLNTQMGLNLTPEQIAALDKRAEGWIAGLQLAALSIQGHVDVAGFVRAFTGSNRFVLDYLAEEVWQRQSPEIQTFLLQTSILDQMNAGLSDAVTGRNDSAQVLAQLERANLFVVPLDDIRQWYRYHHLFADLLQSRLQQSRPEQIAELHRRAGTWYEQNGFVNEAIEHLLAVPDFNRAAALIERAAPALLVRSEDRTLRTWLATLPKDLIHSRPSLGVWQSVALAGGGDFELAEAPLARVDDSQLDPLARGVAVMMRATIALFRSDLPHAIESARNALAGADATLTGYADPEAELGKLTTVFLTMLLAEAEIAAGQFRAALATFRHRLDIGESASLAGFRSIFVGYVHVRLAELFYELNEIDAAAQHATQGLEISHAERNEEFESYALIVLAQTKQAQGDPVAALALGEQAMALVRARNTPIEIRFIGARHITLLIQQGQLDDAAAVARQMPVGVQAIWFLHSVETSVANARVLMARRDFGPAAQLLEQARAETEASGEIRMLVEILALLSLVRREQGDAAQAQTALARALSLAEPEGYVRTFVDLGEPMRLGISDFRSKMGNNSENQPLLEYSDRLLAAFPVAVSETIHKSEILNPKSSMPEPLSERELAVLKLIDAGLSNQEIADRLVVAVSTIKTHINNIYGKLQVGNRVQALARAREQKLLK